MRAQLIISALIASACTMASKHQRKLDPDLCAPLVQVLSGRPDQIEVCGKIPPDGLLVLEEEDGAIRIPIDPQSASCLGKRDFHFPILTGGG